MNRFAASASSSASQPAQRDLPDRAGSRSEPPVPAADVVVLSDSEAYDDAEDVQYDDEEDDDEEPVGAAQGDGDGEGEAALTDEELALQLQVEEQHAHLLELAGFGGGLSTGLCMMLCLLAAALISICVVGQHLHCCCAHVLYAVRRLAQTHTCVSACCHQVMRCAGPGGAYDEDDLDDEEYYPEDEVDPDNMTYEVRRNRRWLSPLLAPCQRQSIRAPRALRSSLFENVL